MSAVREVTLRPIRDSRGAATVEATVVTTAGAVGRAGAPSGASTGTHEVRAFPDGGVPQALETFRASVRAGLLGRDVADQPGWDAELHRLDGTPDLSRVGGNVTTALSLAAATARAEEEHRPLWQVLARSGIAHPSAPRIVGNCLNGGRHAIGGPEFQEFHAVAEADDPNESVAAAIEVHHRIGRALTKRFPDLALGRGDEGGWVAPLTNLEGLEMLSAACAEVRDALHARVHPGLDLAASEFYSDGKYRYRDRALAPDAQVAYLGELTDRFDLRYLEDPLQEEEFDRFAEVTRAVGARALVVGDDLYTTRLERFERGIARGSTNAILIKVNQVGTLTDTFATVDRARAVGQATVTSHRSGDLPEGWLADLAVATGATGLKCGLLGGERAAKLNELLRVAGPTPR